MHVQPTHEYDLLMCLFRGVNHVAALSEAEPGGGGGGGVRLYFDN